MNKSIYKIGLFALCWLGFTFQSCEEIPEYQQEYQPIISFDDWDARPVNRFDVLGTESVTYTKTIKLKEVYAQLNGEQTVQLVLDPSSTVTDPAAIKIEPSSFTIGGSIKEVDVLVTINPSYYKGGYDHMSVLKLKAENEELWPFEGEWIIRPEIENTEEWNGPFEAYVWGNDNANKGDEAHSDWGYVSQFRPHDDEPDKLIFTNFWNAEGDGGEELVLRLEGTDAGVVILETQPVVSGWWTDAPMINLSDTVGTFVSDGINKQIEFDYRLFSEDGFDEQQMVRFNKIDLNSLSGIIHHDWETDGVEFENTVSNSWTIVDFWYGDFAKHGDGTTFDFWRNSVANGQDYDANILYVYNQSVLGVLNNGQPTLDVLAEGTEIGVSSNWVKPETGNGDHYPIVTTPSLTERYGKTFYVGYTLENIYDSDLIHYGWLKCQVSADGTAVTYLEAAFNMKPGASIVTGQTTELD